MKRKAAFYKMLKGYIMKEEARNGFLFLRSCMAACSIQKWLKVIRVELIRKVKMVMFGVRDGTGSKRTG